MEGTTIAEGTSELSTESALQATEGETAARTEIAAPFATGTTAQAAAASTTKPTAAAQIVPVIITRPTAPPTTTTTRTTTPTTHSTTTTTRSTTTTTTRPTTTTTAAPTTATRAASDYEAMGQAAYQTKVIEALNALRTGRGLAPMALSAELSASTLAQAQKMAAAGKSFHTEGIPPGFESVAKVPYDFPAQVLGEMLTNHVQNFLMDGLPVGEYTVTEQRSSLTAGYVLSPAQTVTIEAGKTAEVKIENKLQRGSLRIVKTFEGLDKPLEGVPFRVVGQTVNGDVRFDVKTDKNGEIILKDLPVGTYTVTEQKSDLTKGYVLAPAQTVTVTAGNEAILKITNQLAKGEIRVLKLDKETGEPLEGAMFGLYKNDKLIAEAKSGKDGYAIFKDVEYGEYEIKELSAPVGYNRSEDVLTAIVGKDGSVVLFEVTNERIPGEPVEEEEPEVPVGPSVPLPKTGDSKTIVVIALVVLILAGGAVLWLRKRGKDEDEAVEEPADKE